MKEETRVKIGNLNQQIVILKNKNKEISSSKSGISVLDQLRTNKLIKSSMSKIEITLLFEYIDLILENFAIRLREEYTLNENSLLLAILVRLDFSIEQLAFIFDCETETVYTKKSRLKTSLHLKKEDDLNEFLKRYSSCLYR